MVARWLESLTFIISVAVIVSGDASTFAFNFHKSKFGRSIF